MLGIQVSAPVAAQVETQETLPFTGLSTSSMALLAIALAGIGSSLLMASRQAEERTPVAAGTDLRLTVLRERARLAGPLFFSGLRHRPPYPLPVDYESAIAYLDRHVDLGMKPGLDRMTELLEMMGQPEFGYPIVHVAGTNGKTSTSRLITVILAAHGLNTGTFTSPHLERIEERIGVNGRTSTPEEFAQAVTDVAGFADLFEKKTGEVPSYFELTAATAFAWFSEQSVDAAVVEVGLGGRLDATNAADGEVAVVTGIDFDHTEVLGTTIEQIAAEKLGIVKPGSMLVTGAMPEEALQIARSHCHRARSDPLRVRPGLPNRRLRSRGRGLAGLDQRHPGGLRGRVPSVAGTSSDRQPGGGGGRLRSAAGRTPG